MKKYLPKILIVFLLIGIFAPFHAHAGALLEFFGIDPEQMFIDFLGIVINAVMWLVSWLLYFSGTFLNFILKYTIVDMKLHLKDMIGINIVWKTIRDLMNILFIFFILYEAIKLIIGLSSTEKIGKFVAWLVLSALLINFSLFFTKVLIDASNVVTIGIYDVIRNPNAVNPPKPDRGISDEIMSKLGLQTIFNSDEVQVDLTAQKGIGAMLIYGFGSVLLILVATFVFFAVTIIFVVRYITLLFLLMLSPIAYMGMAFPFMEKHANDWWDSLNGQLLFGPIYMLMTWVAVKLMSAGNFINAASNNQAINGIFDTSVAPTSDVMMSKMNLVMNFIVLIGLLIASLVIAKQTSTKGSKYIGQATNKLTALAGGAVMGGAAAGFRGTVGRAGQAVSDSQWLRERAPDSRLARLALSAGAKTGSASMDVRATALGKNMEMGESGGKGGYQGSREETIRKRMKFAETYLSDTVTGADVENSMNTRRWSTPKEQAFLNTLGLTEAQVEGIQANGASKQQMDALGINAYQAEQIRRRLQKELIQGADLNTAHRRDRYLHDLSQTRWYSRSVKNGVGTDAEAARRMRAGKKAKSTDDNDKNAEKMAEAVAEAMRNAEEARKKAEEEAKNTANSGAGPTGGNTPPNSGPTGGGTGPRPNTPPNSGGTGGANPNNNRGNTPPNSGGGPRPNSGPTGGTGPRPGTPPGSGNPGNSGTNPGNNRQTNTNTGPRPGNTGPNTPPNSGPTGGGTGPRPGNSGGTGSTGAGPNPNSSGTGNSGAGQNSGQNNTGGGAGNNGGGRANAKKDPFDVLGVNRGATADEIKDAWRKKVTENHPDKFTDPVEKQQAEERAKDINEAYQSIKR